jgi:hypothetical protein
LQVQRRHLIAFGDSEYLVRLVRQVVIYETGSRDCWEGQDKNMQSP